MKKISSILLGIFSFFIIFTACDREGIDSITSVDPGADAGSPEVTISYPREGTTINVLEEVSTIDIEFEVVDDIEVEQIEVMVDGSMIAIFNEFTDYRIIEEQVTFDNVTTGEHSVTIKATDIAGNETTETVNFTKEPPYAPRFENEVFYMPFDGDYMELVGLRSPEEVGNPSFGDESYLGSAAYMGAQDSYLSIPLDPLGDEFTAAFWYKLDGSAERAGILTATDDDDRNQGFRLFREPAPEEGSQVIKLNVGTGASDVWNDGGSIVVDEAGWVHIAFSVTPNGTAMYFNGNLVRATEIGNMAIDWSGVENLTIGSGLNFSGWGHNSDPSLIDELRLFDAALSPEAIQNMINASSVTLHMPFNGDFSDEMVNRQVNIVGTPGFAGESVEGNDAYAGAEGAYLTMPSEGLLSDTFSTTFWYKVNASPDRAGIIVISPANESDPSLNNLTGGFHLFREANGDNQRIKANVGNGTSNSWNDGGLIDVAAGEWVHVAFTISNSESKIYLDGELVNTAPVDGGVDWTGADLVSIMSGAPRFTEWNHLSDQSYIDDLRFYNKVLSEEDIEAAMAE
ncbi:LamG-like jellyroll fold domain-containing protein [Salinimicrobium sp. GXAS 041]|uniref:LamG-like jellyroll fold domain-containing protein n=1 Tax=Salinimicrobium sp. GXAS 041 TaxID=3400806 RepID=UPI003C76776B